MEVPAEKFPKSPSCFSGVDEIAAAKYNANAIDNILRLTGKVVTGVVCALRVF